MNKTPITYRRACEILNSKYSTIAAAADRGVFTKLPVTGLEQKLIEEQVRLFEGKSQLRREILSKEERKLWEKYDDMANSTNDAQQTVQTLHKNAEVLPTTFIVNPPDRGTVEYLHQQNLALHASTPSGPVDFQSALIDKLDNKNISVGEAIVILLGLAILFLTPYITRKKREHIERARAKVEQELQGTGLSKEDLVDNQEKSLVALQTHPDNAQRIKQIIKEAGVLVA